MNDETGPLPPAEPRRGDRMSNPFGSGQEVAPLTALGQAEQQRSIAEVQARMIIARSHPRNPVVAVEHILNDCTRPTLAARALYSYVRGGTEITGPTIRLAEAIAQKWGNIASGIKEISRGRDDRGVTFSECVAYAWDLETGFYDERQFQVRHWRDTQKGGYPLKDERDIYELVANMGQRRKRAVLLTVIPGDVVEAAQNQCDETLRANVDISPGYLAKMLAAFEEYDVSRPQIEKLIQSRLDAIRPAQVVRLHKIYESLANGMSNPQDWFEPPEGQPTGVWAAVDQAHAAQDQPTRTAPRKASRKQPAATEQQQGKLAEAPPSAAEGGPVHTTNGQSGLGRTEGESPPTDRGAATTSAGASDRPAGDATASPTAGAVAQQGPPFLVWLIDGDGVAIDGTDEFNTPVAFAQAYVTELDRILPPERGPFVRANKEVLDWAIELDPKGVGAVLAPPPQQQTSAAPVANELPLDAAHDMAVVPRPTRPTKAAYVAFNEALGTKLANATPAERTRIATVNAETINALPATYRQAAIDLIERWRQSPPDARPPLPDVENLVGDVLSLTSPESVVTWLSMRSIVGYLTQLAEADRPGWGRVCTAAWDHYARMRVDACTSVSALDAALANDKTFLECLGWLESNAPSAYRAIIAYGTAHRDRLLAG